MTSRHDADPTLARAPKFARWIVETLAPAPQREFLLGDLEEQYARMAATHGARRAARWYRRQALRSVLSGLGSRERGPRSRARRSAPMVNLFGDVRLALRSTWRSPAFSAVSIATLALAIGATTLLFSIANPLVVRALPIKDADTLGWIILEHPERQVTRSRSSVPDFIEWRSALKSFTEVGAYGVTQGTLTGRGDARRVVIAEASANLPEMWGLTPVAGRSFQPGEDAVGRPRVGLLSFRYWHEAFQGDSRALGETLLIDGRPVTIVGVLPKKIELGNLSLIDIWMPLALDASAPRDVRWVLPMGRLAPGVSLETANAEFQTVFAGQKQQHPSVYDGWEATVGDTSRALASDDTWVILTILSIVVLFVMLIACANLANLVMARLVARRQEIDVRLALGASRWRVVRPFLVEGLLISVVGGALGLGIAYGGLRVINAVAFEAFMRDLAIDRNVLVFTALVSAAAPVVFALWPALAAGRSLSHSMSQGIRQGTGRSAVRRRNVLVGAQVAMALALLVVSSLAVQSMQFLRRTDLGFDPDPLLTWKYNLPAARYSDGDARVRFATSLEERLRNAPGVAGVAHASHLPALEVEQVRALSGTSHDSVVEADRPWASWFAVSPGFFDVMAIPALTGRVFQSQDRAGAEDVAVVSRLTAERYLDGVGAAVGRHVTIHDVRSGDRRVRIVGVVADTRDSQVLRTSPQIYVPFAQWPQQEPVSVLRASDPVAAAPHAREAMRALDPDVAAFDLKPVPQVIQEELSSSRIINGLFVGFAVLALVLASAGLFGVISYSVNQRRREIGVRMALGASPASIGRMVLGQGLRVTGVGAILGIVLALGLARMSASILFGIAPTDPATYVGVTLVVFAVATAAALGPARRARKTDPARSIAA